jgi:hypothetical protein
MGKQWTKERCEYLVERYLGNSCTREELDELLLQAGMDPGNKDLAEALQKHWDLSESPSPAIDWDAKLRAIMRQSSADTAEVVETVEQEALPVIPRWRWYTAVASVFIVLYPTSGK